ncbi:MAG: SurA N-terminal domain-containing protein [Labilithrix sp.]|nr:SurA N-terminal domain-containing protein [Labilithrix sp.]MBX3222128.1 SurA N-terminal domain-containing protein [Labilithrix sp.]
MHSVHRLAIGVLVGAFGFASSAGKEAHASITERVVAVVGESPILLSELRHRARPHLQRIASASSNPVEEQAAEPRVLQEVLNRLIDDRLVEQAADRAHLSVTAEEVDNGIRQVAARSRLAPGDLIAEAERQGLSEEDYREEIRRQILEGKLVQLRVRGRVRTTDRDAHLAYSKWLVEVAESTVDLRIIVPPIAAGAPAATILARGALGQQIVDRARGGEDFCKLVAQYAPTPSPTSKCGSRGAMPWAAMSPDLAHAAKPLEAGQISDPVVFADATGNQAVLVIQRAPEFHATPYEEVREQMMERASRDETERQRKQWLQELRRNVYVDLRL